MVSLPGFFALLFWLVPSAVRRSCQMAAEAKILETIFCPGEKDVETLLILHEASSFRASQVNDDDIEFAALTTIDLIRLYLP